MNRALVVDDSRAMRSILSKVLAESGFEVFEAANGREALDCMDRESLQLVLVDWNMPVLNGLDFVRAVRARPEFSPVRLMMVTTETEVGQMSLALEAGADEYLMKPFARESVKDKLRLMGMMK